MIRLANNICTHNNEKVLARARKDTVLAEKKHAVTELKKSESLPVFMQAEDWARIFVPPSKKDKWFKLKTLAAAGVFIGSTICFAYNCSKDANENIYFREGSTTYIPVSNICELENLTDIGDYNWLYRDAVFEVGPREDTGLILAQENPIGTNKIWINPACKNYDAEPGTYFKGIVKFNLSANVSEEFELTAPNPLASGEPHSFVRLLGEVTEKLNASGQKALLKDLIKNLASRLGLPYNESGVQFSWHRPPLCPNLHYNDSSTYHAYIELNMTESNSLEILLNFKQHKDALKLNDVLDYGQLLRRDLGKNLTKKDLFELLNSATQTRFDKLPLEEPAVESVEYLFKFNDRKVKVLTSKEVMQGSNNASEDLFNKTDFTEWLNLSENKHLLDTDSASDIIIGAAKYLKRVADSIKERNGNGEDIEFVCRHNSLVYFQALYALRDYNPNAENLIPTIMIGKDYSQLKEGSSYGHAWIRVRTTDGRAIYFTDIDPFWYWQDGFKEEDLDANDNKHFVAFMPSSDLEEKIKGWEQANGGMDAVLLGRVLTVASAAGICVSAGLLQAQYIKSSFGARRWAKEKAKMYKGYQAVAFTHSFRHKSKEIIAFYKDGEKPIFYNANTCYNLNRVVSKKHYERLAKDFNKYSQGHLSPRG